jgi:hypothetical protein
MLAPSDQYFSYVHDGEHVYKQFLTGIRISRSSVFCVLFWRSLFVLSLVRFSHYPPLVSSHYPLWYLLITPFGHCSASYRPGDKSCMRKGPGSVYDKWNISVVICNTDIPQWLSKLSFLFQLNHSELNCVINYL